jgi:hypothetical protein
MSGYSTTEGQGSARQAKDEIRQKAEEVKGQAQQKSAEAMDQARESTRAVLDQQKGRAVQSLGSVASALRQTGDSLNDDEQGALGHYVQQAADKIDEFANQLQDRSIDEMLYEAERFARREPEIFLGGAVLLGLLAARFLKASGARRSSMRDWESGGQYGSSQTYPRYRYGTQGSGYYGGQYSSGEQYRSGRQEGNGGYEGSQYRSGEQYGRGQYRSGGQSTPSGEQQGRGGMTGSTSSGYTRPASGYTQSGGTSRGAGQGQSGTEYGSGANTGSFGETGSARGMGSSQTPRRREDTPKDEGGA